MFYNETDLFQSEETTTTTTDQQQQHFIPPTPLFELSSDVSSIKQIFISKQFLSVDSFYQQTA